MRNLLYIICLFLGVAAANAQEEYSRWQLLRSGRGQGQGQVQSSIDSQRQGLRQGREPREREEIRVRNLVGRNSLTVSLLLPLRDARGGADPRFVEFYRGAVLAAEQLREQGVTANIEVFETPRNEAAVTSILATPQFAQSDVVVGPVYPEGLTQVVEWAEQRGVPVVSPLSVYEVCDSPIFFQMPPAPTGRYAKLMELLSQPDVNVVYVSSAKPDPDMERDLRPLLANVPVINYSDATRGATFAAQGDRSARENVFVVSCIDPQTVDAILSKISSVHTSVVARGISRSALRVVGGADWAWFPATMIDRELYFKVGVCWVSNYHVDRTNERVRRFDGRYIAAYGELPPSAPIVRPGAKEVRVRPYAYRGYDAVMLFADAVAAPYEGFFDFTTKLNDRGGELLQVSYDFHRGPLGDWRNENWPLVCYRPDYTIVVE